VSCRWQRELEGNALQAVDVIRLLRNLLQHDHDKLKSGLVPAAFEHLWCLAKQAVRTLSLVSSGHMAAKIDRYLEERRCESYTEGMSKVLDNIQKLRNTSILAQADSARADHQQTQRVRDEWQRCKAEVERLLLKCDEEAAALEEQVPQCAAAGRGGVARSGDGSEEPSQEPEKSSCADGHGKHCSKCGACKGHDCFSGKQWNAKAKSRKCLACVGVG